MVMNLHLTRPTRWVVALTLISLPSVEFGGWFLLNYATGATPGVTLTEVGHDLARGGHGHAGLFLILAMISLMLTDSTCLHEGWKWLMRVGPGAASLLVSGGMFGMAFSTDPATSGFKLMPLVGAFVLAASLIALGVGLIWPRPEGE